MHVSGGQDFEGTNPYDNYLLKVRHARRQLLLCTGDNYTCAC